MNLARYCLAGADTDPEKTALEVVGPGGEVREVWTYGQLTETVLSVAAGLRQAGLMAGDRVLLRIGHSSDFPLMYFGAIAGGFVPIPTSDQLTATETTGILADSGAKLVLHDGSTTLPDSDAVPCVGPSGLADLKKVAPEDFADTNRNDPAYLIYTSGTSGTPKGVLHAHRAALARLPAHTGWIGLTRDDRLLHAGAFNWSYTLTVGLMDPWIRGATSVIYEGPRDPTVWPDILETSRATLFAAVPSLYRRLLKYGNVTKTSFPQLRHGLTAGEGLPAELYHLWKDQTGRELYEALGMSEISTYLSSGPDVPVKPGATGKPQPGRKVALLDENADGEVFALPEQAGLLSVHRDEPGLMLGYWQRPEETQAAFRGDWFLTGDRMRTDADGYYWYEGRADDLMNSFGYRVAPEEVERVLSGHPEVHEVAVTETQVRPGVSLITAFVVPRDPDGFDTDALAERAASYLADYKRPKAYKVLDQLPRTPSGKIRRKDLKHAV
ncbi:class I adenylate-forming enzyme family protein [Roseibium sp. MMSF_3544]|uniref:class I adenylate-forming enzyme family protein n=1 Tax=unclassified Roseibium TaxID=2629323 RepID=UPI00273E7091|nr:acyl-CoA synthetase [Roseibium sp. MMSF_3544]